MGLLAIIAMAEPDPEESAPPPDTELLEFLGSWETASGEWLDPAVFAEAGHSWFIDTVPRRVSNDVSGRFRSVTAGDWKLIWSSAGRRELYRLSDDPGEQRDRAAAEPERVRAMERQLEGWLQGVRDGRPVPVGLPEQTPDEELEEALRALGYAS